MFVIENAQPRARLQIAEREQRRHEEANRQRCGRTERQEVAAGTRPNVRVIWERNPHVVDAMRVRRNRRVEEGSVRPPPVQ